MLNHQHIVDHPSEPVPVNPIEGCGDAMDLSASIPVGIEGEDWGSLIFQEQTINQLLQRLNEFIDRFEESAELRTKLKETLREFVCNLIQHLIDADNFNLYHLARLMISLRFADIGDMDRDGDFISHNTLVRAPNPLMIDPENSYFVIGRDCSTGSYKQRVNEVPRDLQEMFAGIVFIRQKLTSCEAFTVSFEDFARLLPPQIFEDQDLENAFARLFFSDGALALYVTQLGRDIDIF